MYLCENCQCEHDGAFASGRFCNRKCANGFSTKAKREEINEKVSKTLKKRSKTLKSVIFSICPFCLNEFEKKKKRQKFCSRSCNSKAIWTNKEYKERMSLASKKRAKQRIEDGTWPVWQSRKNLPPSFPEKLVISLLVERNILFDREEKVGKYFIDFAFKERNIALEIDGSQHLKEDVMSKDLKKDIFLKSKGWSVFRIPFTSGSKKGISSFLREVSVFIESEVL